jgi:hypothetical protein
MQTPERLKLFCIFPLLLFVQAALLCACGGSGSGDGRTMNGPPPPHPSVDVEITGRAVTKVGIAGGTVALLTERLNSIFEDGPMRSLSLLEADGHTTRSYTAPDGWTVVDSAVHPSGDVSAVLTTARDVRIVRLSKSAAVRSDQVFADATAAMDPFFDYAGGLRDDGALQPPLMHDAARVAALGESLALVLRTGRNAIVAYRLDADTNGNYRQAWRTLVEPGASTFEFALINGSFDVFGALQNSVRVSMDVDANGTIAIGAVELPFINYTFQAHMDYFHEPIAPTVGIILTRLATGDGRRLGSTVIDTHTTAELYAVRATSDGFALVGRVLSEVRNDGTGWNAYVAAVGDDGTAGTYSIVDIDQGDVLFDIATLPSGRYLALGTTGYTQNPTGASISESAQPLLALLNADGSLAQNIGFAAGARHNQLRTIVSLNGHWLLGGMVNGPGTHSGDAQRDLIVADGFLREVSDLPTR